MLGLRQATCPGKPRPCELWMICLPQDIKTLGDDIWRSGNVPDVPTVPVVEQQVA